MSPATRRIVYAISFEGLGIVMSSLFLALAAWQPLSETVPLSVFASILALIWSYVFNWGFEAWESRQAGRGRPFRRRAAHAVLYEGSLTVFLLPATAWFLGVGIVEAVALEIALILFFLVYAWVFTWGFDRVMGLPESAK